MATSSMCSIDLTFFSRTIAPLLDWTVLCDLNGSDHYPVIYISIPLPDLELSLYWILARADWTVFKQSINLPTVAFDDVNDIPDCFTAESAIPLSSGKATSPMVSVDCAVAFRARKRGVCQLRHHPTMENPINYKKTSVQTSPNNTEQ